VTLPQREPGRWDTSHSTFHTPYGTAQGSTSTWVPGSTQYIPVTRPGRTMGYYYPALLLSAYDRASLAKSPEDAGKALVWTSTIVGSSQVGDGVLTGQMLLLRLLRESPSLPQRPEAPGVSLGRALGATAAMLTDDGRNAYPTVLGVTKGSAADKAGLRQWDMVLEVNGRPTANASFAELTEMLAPPAGRAKRLLVKRPEGEVTVHLGLPVSE